MDFFDSATMHDLVRRAGLTSDSPATFYREMQAAAFVERARGVEGMAVESRRKRMDVWILVPAACAEFSRNAGGPQSAGES